MSQSSLNRLAKILYMKLQIFVPSLVIKTFEPLDYTYRVFPFIYAMLILLFLCYFLPISFLDKSKILAVEWLVNFSLWSFRVIEELLLPSISILCLIKMAMGSHNDRSN